MRALTLVCALALVSPARADNTADEADVAFQLGNDAYARRDFELALSHYFLSYRLVPNQNVLFNIARCYEAMKRFNEAYRYYNDLLAMPLPEADRKEVASALARIGPKVALLTVVTRPEGADIFVDREDLGSRGRAPQTLALPPGRHLVRVKLEGYEPAEAMVTLSRGREVKQTLELVRIVGQVAFTGTPAGASVREKPDGPELGRLPVTLPFPPGKHLFHLEAEGHLPAQVLVDVRPKEKAAVEVKLVPKPPRQGKVVVTSNRQNALVKVDGKESGFTPTVLLLPEGEHLLEVSMREMRPFWRRVEVRADAEQRLHAELRYAPAEVQAASKALSSVDESPASITVLTAEEIRAFGWRTLAEALQAVRGVFIADDRIYQRVGIRGFAPPGDLNTRVLILWDGHAMNDVWAGQGYAGRDLAVDLDEVERIEVVRGPGSALYGTGAFFAVINVVSRTSLDAGAPPPDAVRAGVEARAGVGALSSVGGHLAGAFERGTDRAIFSFGAMQMGGAEVTDLGDRGRVYGLDGERALGGSARARVGRFSVQALLNHREKHVPTAPYGTALNEPGTKVVDSRAFAELRYEAPAGPAAVTVRGYYDATRYRGHWVYAPADEGGPPELQTDAGRADWVGAEGRARLHLADGHHLTLGVESQLQLRVDQEVFGGADRPPLETRRRTLFSAYVLDEWHVHPRLLLSAGLRLDKYFDLAELPVTPRVGLVLRPYEGGLTKVLAGTAFRAPNVYELYYGDNDRSQRPALTLSPETIVTVELEHQHELTDELSFTVSAFHNRIGGLVVLVEDPTGIPRCGDPPESTLCLVFQNAREEVRAFGAEGALRWQAGRYALLDASYSFVQLEGGEAAGAATPSHVVSGRLLIPLSESGAHLSAQAVYQSARPRPGERTADAFGEALLLSFGVSGEAGVVTYAATVKNALDARYALPAGDELTFVVPQYGRTFHLDVGVRF